MLFLDVEAEHVEGHGSYLFGDHILPLSGHGSLLYYTTIIVTVFASLMVLVLSIWKYLLNWQKTMETWNHQAANIFSMTILPIFYHSRPIDVLKVKSDFLNSKSQKRQGHAINCDCCDPGATEMAYGEETVETPKFSGWEAVSCCDKRHLWTLAAWASGSFFCWMISTFWLGLSPKDPQGCCGFDVFSLQTWRFSLELKGEDGHLRLPPLSPVRSMRSIPSVTAWLEHRQQVLCVGKPPSSWKMMENVLWLMLFSVFMLSQNAFWVLFVCAFWAVASS